ncbi:pancreatic triacylglycerol lipase-like isoform X1 [Tetranychus urticae]|uniref:pancreatic triacylglycerol lipase-like isoform X1 n=1 Tax=Tetranychus urticae TaxID=32264 RepID=UPI000D64A3D3|nr:pancreatic triacylglycerol lipase-like isoform X1 [Tetranychus urticae]
MVCYRNIGCFRDEGPFDYLDTLPAAPEVINTTFTLYTRLNPIEGSLIDLTNTTSSLNDFKESGPVKIIIHGFGSTGRDPWVLQMTEALLYVTFIKRKNHTQVTLTNHLLIKAFCFYHGNHAS